MTESVIVSAARTPMGRFGGSLADFSGSQLGGFAIKEALGRAGLSPEEVEYVIMGQVLQAGAGQITARQAAVAAGVPKEIPAITINKVCLSGLNAVALADQLIRAGEIQVAVAGGFESMSGAPYLLPAARWGVRMGHAELIDSMIHDGLWSTFTDQHMGESSDEINEELNIGREDQDAWAARSHERAHAAWEEGRMAEEVIAVEVPQRKGDPVVVDRDEGIRPDTTAECNSLATWRRQSGQCRCAASRTALTNSASHTRCSGASPKMDPTALMRFSSLELTPS
jgi:acetyl-CoA C-acetyltransferase